MYIFLYTNVQVEEAWDAAAALMELFTRVDGRRHQQQQQPASKALATPGTQLTCFCSTKIQILTESAIFLLYKNNTRLFHQP